jgi:hypothetical protein
MSSTDVYDSMGALVLALGVVIDLHDPDRATITYQGRSAVFDYIHDTSRHDIMIKGDVLNHLIANSTIERYTTYRAWKEDGGGSHRQWNHDREQARQLRYVLGDDFERVLRQYIWRR